MSPKPTTVYRSAAPAKEEDSVNFREILRKYLFHWPLFIVFIVVCLLVSYVYYKIKKPGYEIVATLQIKDNSKDTKPNSDREALDKLDLANPPKMVENEMEVLRSVSLIKQVVYDLQLWVNYTRTTKLVKQENLYKRSPVKFKLISSNGFIGSQKFDIVIKDKNTFLLKKSNGKFAKFDFKDVLSNSFGTWQLEPTKDVAYYAGATISIAVDDPTSVLTAYQGALSVTQVDKTATTLSLGIIDQLPERGKDFLNDLIMRYGQIEADQRNRITQTTLDFIDNRLKTLTGELSQAENQVQAFSSSRGVNDIDRQSQAYLENTQNNDKELGQVNVQLQVINGIESYINSPGSTSVPSTFGINDGGSLAVLIDKLASLQIEHDRMLATTPEANPQFDPINRQIKATRSAIQENVKNIKKALLAQQQQLNSYNNKLQSSIRSVPEVSRDFLSLKREQSMKADLYTYLKQKREEVALSYASILSDAQLVDPAYVLPQKAAKKYAPFGVALALGFLLPIGLIYGRSSIKNTVTSARDITAGTDLPIICELSYEKSKSPIVVHDRRKFAIAEEFRTLRTKLHYLHGTNEKGRVTLLTSSVSGEGKSFIATNLAVAIAASGRKTAILEMDLRKPRVSVIFGLDTSYPGISNYLNGEVSEAKIVQKIEAYPNLDVLGSGDYYSNPSELLEQDRLEKLMTWLRNNYDDIVIDTPPVNVVTDAFIVGRAADVTLYTVRQGHTSNALLPFIKSINAEEHLPKLNIVFNGIEKGRYGYSGYGYGYGDYVPDKQTKKKYANSIFRDFFKRF